MLNQYAVDYPTFPVNRRDFHLIVILEGLLSRNDKPPDTWNTHGISGNVFANPPRLLHHLVQEDSILGFVT